MQSMRSSVQVSLQGHHGNEKGGVGTLYSSRGEAKGVENETVILAAQTGIFGVQTGSFWRPNGDS